MALAALNGMMTRTAGRAHIGAALGAALLGAAATSSPAAAADTWTPNTIGPPPRAGSLLPPEPGTLNPIRFTLPQVTEGVREATADRQIDIGPYPATFQPVHVTADPFAQGFGHIETDVWIGHVQADQMRFAGSAKVETGFEGGFLIRHTLGGDSGESTRLGNVLHPNFIGPTAEFYQRVTLPLDAAARADDDASRAAGKHVGPEAHSLDGSWLARAVSGGTHLFAQT